jgi:hypothetical protein
MFCCGPREVADNLVGVCMGSVAVWPHRYPLASLTGCRGTGALDARMCCQAPQTQSALVLEARHRRIRLAGLDREAHAVLRRRLQHQSRSACSETNTASPGTRDMTIARRMWYALLRAEAALRAHSAQRMMSWR